MPYFVLGIAVLVGVILIARGAAGADPKVVARLLKGTALGFGALVLVFLIATGRFGLASMIFFGSLPVILRWRALSRMARSWRGPSPGQRSDIETAYLRMSLDHDTGMLKGTVLEGHHRGRLLEELTPGELMELLQECRVHDEQSATLLESYLDRVYGAEWRGGEGAEAGAGQGGGGGGSAGAGPATGSGRMTRNEAYEILGLSPGADADAIKQAHHRLMLKIHPDHGGTTYLAAKINQAKDVLLAASRGA
jgi:DnaJ domain